MSDELTAEELAELRRMLADMTDAPWGWRSYGDKCNAAVVGTFVEVGAGCLPVGGHVETERWNEATGEYETLADIDESIAYKDDNARFSDFAGIVQLRNAAHKLIAAAERASDHAAALRARDEEIGRLRHSASYWQSEAERYAATIGARDERIAELERALGRIYELSVTGSAMHEIARTALEPRP
jgi:hypothetical protein